MPMRVHVIYYVSDEWRLKPISDSICHYNVNMIKSVKWTVVNKQNWYFNDTGFWVLPNLL